MNKRNHPNHGYAHKNIDQKRKNNGQPNQERSKHGSIIAQDSEHKALQFNDTQKGALPVHYFV